MGFPGKHPWGVGGTQSLSSERWSCVYHTGKQSAGSGVSAAWFSAPSLCIGITWGPKALELLVRRVWVRPENLHSAGASRMLGTASSSVWQEAHRVEVL